MVASIRSLHGTGADGTDQLLTDSQAAALLGVSASKVSKMRAGGLIETVRIGSAARCRLSDVLLIIRGGRS